MGQTTENNILLHITGKKMPADVTVNELLELTRQYPAFGPAQLLLAKKAQNDDGRDKDKYAQMAALHFVNPHWFHFKMNEDELMKNVTLTAAPVTIEDTPTEDVDDIIIQGFEGTLAEEDAPANNEGVAGPGENILVEQQVTQVEPAGIFINEPGEIARTMEEMPAIDEVVGGEPKEGQTGEAVQPTQDEEINEDIAVLPGQHYVESEAQPEAVSPQTEDEIDANDTGMFEDADAENESLTPALNEKISSVLHDQLQEFKKPVAENTPVPIESEPYHTVDYFASQGIKLSAELQKQDNLGVKVKKFTDWLKQMKRINPTPIDLGIDEAAEHKVQDSAASSNEPKEVVTEAMAEVLAMQGMKEKAIQVYIKLSFLDPSKTAYFAAKIEQLKGM